MPEINYIYLTGQIMGFIAVILGFITFQMKSPQKLLMMQIAVSAAFSVQYLLIGSMTGFTLNAISILRNFIYSKKDVKIFSYKFYPYLIALIMCIVGSFSWEGWYSAFMITGLAINTVCMSFDNPQNIRKSILVTSPLVIVYNVCVLAVGGIIYESVVIISSAIGIVRTNIQNKQIK